MVAEVQNNTVTANYLRVINLISRAAGTTTEYYLFNAHGDVVNLVNTDGTVTKSYDYDAFGNERNPSAADPNPFRYCGEYWDNETGTYYLRARYYDPLLGRFTQQDQMLDGINWYTYCYNSPLFYVDRSGNIPVETIADLASLGWSLIDFAQNPSWAYVGYLAWDIAALLPYVPGSYAIRGAKYISKADDALDIARAFSRADNLTDAANLFLKNKNSIVMGYRELKKTVKSLGISGLEVHHLIEKRFAIKLGIKANDILSVAIDKDLHQKITKAFRNEIGYALDLGAEYTTITASPQQIWEATVNVYRKLGLEEYLPLLKEQLMNSETASKITDWLID